MALLMINIALSNGRYRPNLVLELNAARIVALTANEGTVP